MSDMQATVEETKRGFQVVGYEKIEYGFTFIDNIFDVEKPELADCYKKWGRCLAVMDSNIFEVYGERVQKYFDHYNLDLSVHKTMIGEKAKSLDTFSSIVDSMTTFGIIRKVRKTYPPKHCRKLLTSSRSLSLLSVVDLSRTLLGKKTSIANEDHKALWPILST